MRTFARLSLILAVAMAGIAAGCSDGSSTPETETEIVPTEVPAEIVELVDDWQAANERGDGSVTDLYVLEGYHLYGDRRYEHDELVQHFSGGGEIEHEWLTDPLLVAADEDGRYVVVRGMRNSGPRWSNSSALLFEIVTTPAEELRIVQTAWFYDSEW